MVNRRSAIKQFLFISAGAALIPSCIQDKSKASVILKNISIDVEQEKMMAELSETIIPKTETPGAKDVSAHLFALKMVDDCYKKDEQQRFIKGLAAFEKSSKEKFGKSFVAGSSNEREQLLSELEARKDTKDDLSFFYATMKRLTIQAYTTSQFYLTQVHVYKLIPGPYKGCVPVNSTKITS